MKYLLHIALSALGVSGVAHSTPMELEYSSFYSHVKKLDDEDTEALRFAFGFKHIASGGLCTIHSAHIHTQKKQIPLDVNAENRFTVPLEKALKLARALVIVDVEEAHNQCDMSVQLETKPEYLKTSYTGEDLAYLFAQYDAFFSEMGGFLSFLMPSATGLRIQLQEGTDVEGKDLVISQNTLLLDEDRLKEKRPLTLSAPPVRITAMTAD